MVDPISELGIPYTESHTSFFLFFFLIECICNLGTFDIWFRWAGETDPRIIFRNIVQRPRHKATGTRLFFGFLFYFFCVLIFPFGSWENIGKDE